MNSINSIRTLLDEEGLLMIPGAYNALTAKIIEDVGFKAVYMTGYGTAASSFGYPDIGLLTMTEMVQNATRITNAVSIPVISDADTGYGNPINVFRTVQEFERVGVSAIHIEDQKWPKRCGHMAGKKVIDSTEMVKKIKTAIDARKSEDFLIIARTDAIATQGFKEAIRRAIEYAEAGADILFLDAPRTKNQVKKIPQLIDEKPLLINLSPKTPNFSKQELEEMGYKIAIYPGVCLAATILSCMNGLEELKRREKPKELKDIIESFSKLNEFLGSKFYYELDKKYESMENE